MDRVLAAMRTESCWQLGRQLCEARLASAESARRMREQVATGWQPWDGVFVMDL